MAKKAQTPTFDFVVVSNRLPVNPKPKKDGTQSWVTTPGGLVAALAPVMRNRDAAWVGWPGLPDVTPEPFTQGKTYYVPVAQSEQDLVEFYEGFSNATIWPLYHDVIVHPEYHREWWDRYQDVNKRFADAAAAVASEGGFVWVHDYQLQLVPQMLRKLRPDLKIGYFHHIPFPGYDLFAQLPWRAEILHGLLGADVVGFQRESDAENMRHAISRNLGYSMQENIVRVPVNAGPKRDRNAPPTTASKTRQVTVDAFPISLDQAAIAKLADSEAVQQRAKEIRAELGKPKTIFLGVDRLDYTKGIRHRFKAFGEMLEEGTLSAKTAVFVQLASPSRERVESYKHLRDDIEIQVGRINGEYGHVGRPAIVYLHQNISREEMVAMYLAADVMVVSPLRDGMNLVAKEFVASRADDLGVLVLSEFAGAADELDEALLINPHDIDGVKATFAEAAAMAKPEQQRRMRALRKVVQENDVKKWATSFLDAVSPKAPARRR
jgi:trehalose 6-phosphate synthase